MVVTVPVDALGNPMPDGTVVVVDVSRPDGTTRTCPPPSTNGIAAVRFPSTTLAGPLAIAASSGDARGPAVRVDQVAGRPAPFSLLVPEGDADRPRIADGRTLHDPRHHRLLDEHGNVLPDGVSVDVRIDTPTGPGRLTTQVIAGRAEFHIESPTLPGVVRLEPTVDGVTGAPISLTFDRAVDVVPARIDDSDDDRRRRTGARSAGCLRPRRHGRHDRGHRRHDPERHRPRRPRPTPGPRRGSSSPSSARRRSSRFPDEAVSPQAATGRRRPRRRGGRRHRSRSPAPRSSWSGPEPGADPADAFTPTDLIPESLRGSVTWLDDAPDLDRAMEPTTRRALEAAWLRQCRGRTSSTPRAARRALDHELRIGFYSLDGQIVGVTATTLVARDAGWPVRHHAGIVRGRDHPHRRPLGTRATGRVPAPN